MLDDLFNHLIAVAADELARPFDAALASQDAMRARRDEYRSRLAEAAKPALAALGEAFVEAQRARFEGWLAHPHLGHGALVDEGRLADKIFQKAVANHQAMPSAASWLDVGLAACRVAAITRVVGVECIYLEPKPRKSRGPAGAKDRRKSRRSPQVSDVPTRLLPSVAKLASGDPKRADAIARLRSTVQSDTSGLSAKLEVLSSDPQYDQFLSELAKASADTIAQDQATQIERDIGGADGPGAEDTELQSQPGTPEAAHAIVIDDCGSLDRSQEEPLDDDGGAQAQLIYGFVRRMLWALQPESDGRISLKPLRHKPDVTDAFAAVGHLPAVQNELRAILDELGA